MPPLLEAMRPRQWSKNVFVLAGIVFAGRLFDRPAQLRVLACFALFCALWVAALPSRMISVPDLTRGAFALAFGAFGAFS